MNETPIQKRTSLKRISTPVAEIVSASKAKRPVAIIAGNSVDRYAKAVAALKSATADKTETQEVVFEAGVKLLVQTNIANPGNPISSVEVTDATGATAQVQFRDVYSAVDGDIVSEVFESQLPGLDVNDFVHEIVVAKFDSSVFLVNGEFDEKRYEAFKVAIDNAAKCLNIASPLSSSRKVTAKPNFHASRWTAVKTVEQQLALQAVLPASIAGKVICEGTREIVESASINSTCHWEG
jgi:hypothetical protein